jgi:hypothetical protein
LGAAKRTLARFRAPRKFCRYRATFGAGLLAFRLTDLTGFAEAQASLNRTGAAASILVPITTDWLAALAIEVAKANQTHHLSADAIALGMVSLNGKGAEYADLRVQGIDTENHARPTFS